MTLAELANRTSLSLRQLRYVLDQGLLPAGRVDSSGRGVARYLTEHEAFAIATAAVMMQAGLRQNVIRECVALLCRYETPQNRRKHMNDVPLYQAYLARETSRLEIGDGVNMRLTGINNPQEKALDTGWRQIATGAKLDDQYEPLIVITINLGLVSRRMA
jgi:hypothetical protein